MSRMKPPLVPLATLIGRELRSEKVEKPFVKYGQAGLAKKGEDYYLIKLDCERVPGNPSTSFSVFAVLFLSKYFGAHTRTHTLMSLSKLLLYALQAFS